MRTRALRAMDRRNGNWELYEMEESRGRWGARTGGDTGNEIKKGKKGRYKGSIGWEGHSCYQYQMFQVLPSRSFLGYRNLVLKVWLTGQQHQQHHLGIC